MLAAGILREVLAVLVLANPIIGTNKAPIWVALSLVVMGGAAGALALRLRSGGVHFTGFLVWLAWLFLPLLHPNGG